MALTSKGLDGLSKTLGRTLEKLHQKQLITPYFEKALLTADWPEEYTIKVYNKERTFDGYFHPSSHTLTDPLQLYYEFHPEHRKNMLYERNSPELEMTFQIGHALHALVESMFIHLGFTTPEDCEAKFRDEERHASGTLDVRKFYLPNGEWLPVDIKSCQRIPKEPYPAYFKNYIAQLNVYMDLAYDEPVERSALFFIEKPRPHRIHDVVVERDEKLLSEIYERWALVREALENDDPSILRNCCNPHSKEHIVCPARMECRIGAPRPSGA